MSKPTLSLALLTLSLLAWTAAVTERVRVASLVHSLPLRPPAVLARAAASIDLLSGGRFELGLGAGTFWDAVEAMGGPRRSPGESLDALEDARKRGKRVLAVGTTVVRALEGAARNKNGVLAAGSGTTDLIIDKSFHPQIVSGILTGVHDPAQSHFRLLRAFAGERILRHAWRHAAEEGYLCHEFGDLCLILPRES